MAAPTFVSSTATSVSSSATPKTTASIAVQSGDVLVAHGLAETAAGTLTIATATGSTSAWTLQQSSPGLTTSAQSQANSWTATATATGNITVTVSSSTTLCFCGIVKVWRSSNGIGNTNKANNGNGGSSAPSVGVTTTGANSGLDFCCDDWSAVAGTITFTASNGTPVSDFTDQTLAGANYCLYTDHVLDAGTAGAKTMGMSSPSTQRYGCNVIEVLGGGVADVLAAQIWL